MRDVVLVGLLFAAFVVIGFGLVVAAGIPLVGPWLVTALGLAPLVGALACGSVAMVFVAVGVRIDLAVALAATAVIVGVAVAVRPRSTRDPWCMRSRPHRRARTAVEICLLAVLAILAGALLRLFAASTIEGWDGWAIWALHANALFVDGTATGPVFTDPVYLGSHPEYPILYPELEALAAEAVGRFDPGVVLLIPAFILISSVVAIWAVLRTRIEPVVAAAVALALLGMPTLVANFRLNYADGAVALVGVLGALFLLLWLLSASRVPLVFGAGLLTWASLIKLEGLIFGLAALVAVAIAARGEGRSVRSLAWVLGVVVMPVVAWSALLHVRGVHQDAYRPSALVDPDYLGSHWRRATLAGSSLFDELTKTWSTAVAVLILALVLAFIARRPWPAVFLIAWVSLSFGGLVMSYLASTPPIEWHLATSASRVVFTIAIGVLVTAPVVVTDAWDRLDRPLRSDLLGSTLSRTLAEDEAVDADDLIMSGG